MGFVFSSHKYNENFYKRRKRIDAVRRGKRRGHWDWWHTQLIISSIRFCIFNCVLVGFKKCRIGLMMMSCVWCHQSQRHLDSPLMASILFEIFIILVRDFFKKMWPNIRKPSLLQHFWVLSYAHKHIAGNFSSILVLVSRSYEYPIKRYKQKREQKFFKKKPFWLFRLCPFTFNWPSPQMLKMEHLPEFEQKR